jgi:hypothetical protein
MKEPDYVMWMMAMGRPLGDNETCKETIHYWKDGGIEVCHRFRYKCLFAGIFGMDTPLMITRTFGMGCH